jgi:two-component system nitrogen regulation response regulator GlnG
MGDLLLIDDDPGQLVTQVRQAFSAPGHRIAVARTGAEGVARVRATLPDVVLLSLRLPDQCGLAVYRQIRGLDGRVPVIFVTGSRKARAAIEAMKQGAYDCLVKPPDPGQLAQVVGEALEIARQLHEPSLGAEPAAAPETGGQLVGACPAMRQVYKEIGLVAVQDFPVIITGESGTGKELVARAIHEHSNRAGRPFLALNAAAIPEALLESELFGHEKGAFTGAHGKRVCKFQQCHGGTLFLDEIGDMPLAMQAKLLRVLHEQAFERVGGNEPIQTDAVHLQQHDPWEVLHVQEYMVTGSVRGSPVHRCGSGVPGKQGRRAVRPDSSYRHSGEARQRSQRRVQHRPPGAQR